MQLSYPNGQSGVEIMHSFTTTYTPCGYRTCALLVLWINTSLIDAMIMSLQIILASVICSFVFFLFGILVGALCHRWARVFTKPCTSDIKHSNGTIHEHPSPTDTPADTAAPVVYEEITSDSTSRQKNWTQGKCCLWPNLGTRQSY